MEINEQWLLLLTRQFFVIIDSFIVVECKNSQKN